jgi:hypothetical protein
MLKIARGALCGLKEPTEVAMRVKAPPLCKFIGGGGGVTKICFCKENGIN